MQVSMLLAAGLFLIFQVFPNASALFDQGREAISKLSSLHYVTEITVELSTEDTSVRTTVKQSVYRVNPGKSRMETESSLAPGTTVISDGEYVWTYEGTGKVYTKTSVRLGQSPAMTNGALPNIPDLFSGALNKGARVIGEDAVEVDGKARPCWVMEFRLGDLLGPLNQNLNVPETMKTCVDKELGLALNIDFATETHLPGKDKPVQIGLKIKTRDLKINESFPDSLFTFTPPPDAVEAAGTASTPSKIDRVQPAPHIDLTGKPAPAFDAKSLDGRSFSLPSLKGKPVLLSFCQMVSSCDQSVPAMEAMARDYKSRGLVVLGIYSAEQRNHVEAMFKARPASYAIIADSDSTMASAFKITSYPTYVLIDNTGRVVVDAEGSDGEGRLRFALRDPDIKVLQARNSPNEDEVAYAKLNSERNTDAKTKLILAFEQSYPNSKHLPEVLMDFSKILVSESDFTRAVQYAEKAVNAVDRLKQKVAASSDYDPAWKGWLNTLESSANSNLTWTRQMLAWQQQQIRSNVLQKK